MSPTSRMPSRRKWLSALTLPYQSDTLSGKPLSLHGNQIWHSAKSGETPLGSFALVCFNELNKLPMTGFVCRTRIIIASAKSLRGPSAKIITRRENKDAPNARADGRNA